MERTVHRGSCVITSTCNNFKLSAIVVEEDLCSEVLVLSISVQSGRAFITLGDKEIECHPNFRMYLTTKLSNPVLNPALCAKANVINYTVTAVVSVYGFLSICMRPDRSK